MNIPRNPAANFNRNPAAPWRHLDLALIGATLATACLGVLMVWSATRSTEGPTYLFRQAAFVVIGLVVMAVVTMVDYRHYRDVAPFTYAGMVTLLLLVLSPLGTVVNGSRSWFAVGSFQLQPAEFMKLAAIIFLAALASPRRGALDGRGVVGCLVVVGVPAGLIIMQPDVGSTMVFGAVVVGILVVSGATARHLLALALVAVIAVIGIFELGLIEDYQRDRLTYFASPGDAVSEAAYNAEQAEQAIGNGGLTGRGIGNGTQTKLGFVPYQQSDFIFTVVGEELGFTGSATLLLLYAVMSWRIWRAATVARDLFGTLVCIGVLSMLLFQVFENMGMTMGIMPITGIPLPFMSYGGSSTIMMFAAIGLVLNVHTRRFS